jgi:hypothetical protein
MPIRPVYWLISLCLFVCLFVCVSVVRVWVVVYTCWIPRRHDDAPIGGIGLDSVNDVGQLIDSLASVVGLGSMVFRSEMPPLFDNNSCSRQWWRISYHAWAW